jgi:hypothetical protein
LGRNEIARNKVGGQEQSKRGLDQDDVADAEQLAQAPKMEQFPAPSPLTDQEKMLARYVRNFPERAALMARAQTELRKRDELEMAAPFPAASFPANAAGGSEQQPE